MFSLPRVLGVVAAMAAAMCATAGAATFTFSGDGDASTWSDPANWVGGLTPASTSDGEGAADVVIDGAHNVVITADIASIKSLTLRGSPGAQPTVTIRPGVTLNLQSIDIAQGGLILGAPGAPATITWSKSNRGHLICHPDGYIAGAGTITTRTGFEGVQLLSSRADAFDMTGITLAMKYHEYLRVASADLGREHQANWAGANLCLGTLALTRDNGDYTLAQADGGPGDGTNALYCRVLDFDGAGSKLDIGGLNVYVRDRVEWFDGAAAQTPGALTVASTFGAADPTTSLLDRSGSPGQAWVGVGVPTPPATVVGRRVLYAGSSFATPGLDGAVAPDKIALTGGQTATFANYTGYSRGLNAVAVDIANLRGLPTADDFQFVVGNTNDLALWTPAPAPQNISIATGAGADGSDRVTIRWADNAIAKQWLAVVVRPTAVTGLPAADVFYFGNAVGETGNAATDAIVNAADAADVAANPTADATIGNPYDHDRDGDVDAADVAISTTNAATPAAALILLNAPATPTFNRAPIVSAGADLSITLPAAATLTGSARDDGLPAPPTMTYAWTLHDGPAPVGFTPDNAAIATATFTEPGLYTLQLTAGDGSLSGSDLVTVTVAPALLPNTYYVDRNHLTAGDANAGGESDPWLTLGHAIANVAPGDTIYVKDGIYRESLKLSIDGAPGRPITLAGHPGGRAVLSGAGVVTGFRPCTAAIAQGNPAWTNMYYVDIAWRPLNLYQDGVPLDYGRTPDNGWWNVEAATASTVTDTSHLTQSNGYWTGAQMFLWRLSATQQYITNIIDSDQASASVTYDSLKYVPEIGDRYYLRNKVELITDDGQWAVEDIGRAYRVYLWPRNDADPGQCLIEGPSADISGGALIDVFKMGYWVFDGLELRHSAAGGVYGAKEESAGHVTVSNCSIHHNEGTGVSPAYNHGGVYRRNYIAYNGGIDGLGISTGGADGLLIEENEIAFNGKDGLRINGANISVRRNYVHGNGLWRHADNCQTYGGGVQNVLLEENFILNGGRNYMMEDVVGITFRGNVIAGSRGNMLIFGHGSNSDATLIANTFFFPGGSMIDTSGGDGYFLRNNIAVTGHLGGFWSAGSSMTYDSDYNLFCFADGVADTEWRVVLWDGDWTARGLDAYVTASGHDTHSLYAWPMFANAPDRYVTSNGSRLAELTPTRTYIDPADAPLFVVGEHIELDWDGVLRTITAVGVDYVEFAPAEPRLRRKAPVMCLWRDNANFTLDLSLNPGSPALGAATDGGPLGAPIHTVQFAIGDFTGDGVRDIPVWPEDPALGQGAYLPGDADRDGDVDLEDFVTLKNNFGSSDATWADGDFNGDAAVTLEDFVILKTHFGTTAAVAARTAIAPAAAVEPAEPASPVAGSEPDPAPAPFRPHPVAGPDEPDDTARNIRDIRRDRIRRLRED